MSFKARHVYQVLSLKHGITADLKNVLVEMGFLPGICFRVLRVAPFGTPYQIALRQKLWMVRPSVLAALNCLDVTQTCIHDLGSRTAV